MERHGGLYRGDVILLQGDQVEATGWRQQILEKIGIAGLGGERKNTTFTSCRNRFVICIPSPPPAHEPWMSPEV
jgi:hypothetical protein